jgi:hypothetical protein
MRDTRSEVLLVDDDLGPDERLGVVVVASDEGIDGLA